MSEIKKIQNINYVNIIKQCDVEKIYPLFEGWEETMIYSCLSGIMGKIIASSDFKSASAAIGDFCFLAGKPNADLVSYDYGRDFLIMTPQNEEWASLIEDVYDTKVRKHTRYSVKKEPDCFNRQKLKKIAAGLPDGFSLSLIDEKLYNKCLSLEWCRDFVCNFETYKEYKQLGIGVVALKDGQIAAGASSHTRYPEGIEIEIATREDFRRLGLASVCGAALILKCLNEGLYPSWDAHDMRSLHLAEKLGYHSNGEYTVYILEKQNYM